MTTPDVFFIRSHLVLTIVNDPSCLTGKRMEYVKVWQVASHKQGWVKSFKVREEACRFCHTLNIMLGVDI